MNDNSAPATALDMKNGLMFMDSRERRLDTMFDDIEHAFALRATEIRCHTLQLRLDIITEWLQDSREHLRWLRCHPPMRVVIPDREAADLPGRMRATTETRAADDLSPSHSARATRRRAE